jgi:hypothetical protein
LTGEPPAEVGKAVTTTIFAAPRIGAVNAFLRFWRYLTDRPLV